MQVRSAALLLALAAVLATGCSLVDRVTGEPPQQAQWAVDPAAAVTQDATELPLLVGEVACASGRDASGRIEVAVDYHDDSIVITAYVRPREGDQDCQGNPPTPYLLQLDEPIGERELINGATDEIAQRPLELGDQAVDDGGSAAPSGMVVAEGDVADRILLRAEALMLWAHRAPEPVGVGDLAPHPDGVDMVLGDRLAKTVSAQDLDDPDSWVLPAQEYAGYVGPFSILETLARAKLVRVTPGAQPHCASPPRPSPVSYADLQRVALEPTETDSCLQWFVVNLYLDDQDLLRAVQLDLWAP